MRHYQLAIIGAGPAGLAAAVKAYENGVKKILVIERDKILGGILNQCIHNGFGLHRFKQELTGPEYADRYIKMLNETSAEIQTDTMVLNITKERILSVISPLRGFENIKADAVILAMGCRERTRGAIRIPGSRPSGIFTAGTAQRYINIDGYMVGRRAVILGSGDIGLIMARRMTLEGAKVLACIEVMPYSSGLNRNIVQCLNDFDIPLYLSHTVIDIKGANRLEKVIGAKVDENRRPIKGTEMEFDCDTLLLSIGLIPENELTRACGIQIDFRTNGAYVYENMQTSCEGIFACGNVVHVHDLVDYVSEESEKAGEAAAKYILGDKTLNNKTIEIDAQGAVTYTVPQRMRCENIDKNLKVFFRVNKSIDKAKIIVSDYQKDIASFKKQYVVPGEMQNIILAKNQIENIRGDYITIRAEEIISE